jgi:hypothetical protein
MLVAEHHQVVLPMLETRSPRSFSHFAASATCSQTAHGAYLVITGRVSRALSNITEAEIVEPKQWWVCKDSNLGPAD